MQKKVEHRCKKFSKYLENLSQQSLREFSDLVGLDGPGLYFIYEKSECLVYVGSTDRALSSRLKELRDQPKDHTFHAKLVRKAIEEKLGRKVKKFNAKKLSQFSGHELISTQEFSDILATTKHLIAEGFK